MVEKNKEPVERGLFNPFLNENSLDSLVGQTQELVGGSLTGLPSLESIMEDPSQPLLTKQLLSDPLLRPKGVVGVEGRFFFLTSVMEVDKDREQVVMFVKMDDGQLFPRILYKSKSGGDWRTSPGERQFGNYSKGKGIEAYHYTQTTKLDAKILDYLEQEGPAKSQYEGDILFKYFGWKSPENQAVDTFDQSFTRFDDAGSLEAFQEKEAGYSFSGAREYFQNLEYPTDFVPDFTKDPIGVQTFNHSLLGAITIEIFEGLLQDQEVEWSMAYDKEGRVWIDRIAPKEGMINSYGCGSCVIDSGILTSKPLEHRQSAKDFTDDEAVDYYDHSKMKDITPLLDNLKPIQDFREARGISRKIKALF